MNETLYSLTIPIDISFFPPLFLFSNCHLSIHVSSSHPVTPHHSHFISLLVSCSVLWDTRTWEERLRRALLEEFIRDKVYLLSREELLQHTTVRILVPLLHKETTFFQFVTVLKEMNTNNMNNVSKAEAKERAEVVLQYVMWSELPSHQSTRSEMTETLQKMAVSFSAMATTCRPAVVTIACSCQDGFIQEEDVQWLVGELLVLLNSAFGTLEVLPEREVTELYKIEQHTMVCIPKVGE